MKRSRVLVLASIGLLAACDSLKGAMTSHVDTVAQAAGTELSSERLGTMLGKAQAIPLQGPQAREIAKNLSNLWLDYHLMAEAAAKGDSLLDEKSVNKALWAMIAESRIRKLGETVLANPPLDTANAQSRYDRGELLAAKHILIGFGGRPQPGQQVPQATKDSARRKAEALLPQVTAANFAQLASKNSADPGSAAQGGALGVFPRGVMVPQFEQAVTSLKPGQISQLVETPFGYHIIYRPTFAEVAQQFTQSLGQRTKQVAESTYLAQLEQNGKVEVKGDAALFTKGIAADVEGYLDNDKVLATSVAGDLKASRVAEWIQSLPGGPQLRMQIQQAPDSLVTQFVRRLVRNELLLKQADSAKVQVDTAELANMKGAYKQAIVSIWTGLGVSPTSLADSAKDAGAKSKLAAARVDAYLDRLTQQQAPFVEVPAPIAAALRAKFDHKFNDGALDKALEKAATVRASADSAKAASQPATAIPLPGAGGPGAMGGAPMPGAAPQGAAPQGAAPQGAAPQP